MRINTKIMMLISMLLILFLSIAVASASDISADDAISSDAGTVTVSDTTAEDDMNLASNDISSDEIDELEETQLSSTALDEDDSALLADDNPDEDDSALLADDDSTLLGDGEDNRTGTHFSRQYDTSTTRDYAYIYVDLYDDDDYYLNEYIDIYVNNEFYSTMKPYNYDEYKISGLAYGMNGISLIFNGTETYKPCQVDFTIHRADKESYFSIDAPPIYYGNDATIEVALTTEDFDIINDEFEVLIYALEDEEIIFQRTFNLTGNGTITIPAADLLENKYYYINATFMGNAEYTYIRCENFFKVIGSQTHFDVYDAYFAQTDDEFNYNVYLSDELYDCISGYIDVYLNGDYLDTVELDYDGYGSIALRNLQLGVNTLFLKYNGSDFYDSCNATVNVTLYEKRSRIEVDFPHAIYAMIGDIVNLTAYLRDSGTGEIINENFDIIIRTIYYDEYDDKEGLFSQGFIISNGSGTLQLNTGSLAEGQYEIVPKFNGTSVYAPSVYRGNEYGEYCYIDLRSKKPVTMDFGDYDESVTEDSVTIPIRIYDDWSYDYDIYDYQNIVVSVDVYLNGEYYATIETYESGYVDVAINSLQTGANTIEFRFNGTERYENCSDEITVSYYDQVAVIEIEGLSYEHPYGQDIDIYVRLLDGDDNPIDDVFTVTLYDAWEWSDEGEYATVIAQSVVESQDFVTFSADYLGLGCEYVIVAKYNGTDSIAPVKVSRWIFIVDNKPTVNFYIEDIPDIGVDDDLVFYIVLTDEFGERQISSEIEVRIYTEDAYYDDEDPIFVANYNSNEYITVDSIDFTAGSYVIRAIFDGSDEYQSAYTTNFFNVCDAKKTNIHVNAPDIGLGRNATIYVNLTNYLDELIDGVLTVEVYTPEEYYEDERNPVFTGTVNSGEYCTVDASLLYESEYYIEVRFAGNESYDASYGRSMFHVYDKEVVNIDIDMPTVYDSCRPNVTVTLTDYEGNIIDEDLVVKLYDEDGFYDPEGTYWYKTTVHSGVPFTLNFDLYEGSTYFLVASYPGSDTYISKSKSVEFKVLQQTSSIVLDVPDIELGEPAIISVYIYDQYGNLIDDDADIEIYTEDAYEEYGEPFYQTRLDSGSSLTVSEDEFTAGTYVVVARFEDSDVYAPSFKVERFTVQGSLEDTEIQIDVDDISLGQEQTIVATLTDSNDEFLNDDLTIKVYTYEAFMNDDLPFITETVQTDEPFSIGAGYFTSGTYYVEVVYEGNETYKPSRAFANFTVEESSKEAIRIGIIQPGSTDVNNVDIKFRLLDSSDNLIAGDVDVYLNDEFYATVSLEAAEYTLNISPLKAGNNKVVLIFNETDQYLPCEETEYVTYNKPTVSIPMSYSSPINVNFTTIEFSLKDPTYGDMEDYLDIYVDGEFYETVLTVAGSYQNKLNLRDLTIDNHTVKFVYNETDSYAYYECEIKFEVLRNGWDTETNLDVSPMICYVDSEVSITPTVSCEILTEPLSVELYINGSYVGNVTSGETFIFTPQRAGEYSIIAKYVGDDVYHSSESTVKTITVNKHDIGISVSSDKNPVKVGEEANLRIYINDTVLIPLDVYVDNAKLGTINSNESYIYAGSDLGNHSIHFAFAGNEKYNPSVSPDIQIKVYTDTKISIDARDVFEGDDAIITINLTDDGNQTLNREFTIKINEIASGNSIVDTAAIGSYSKNFNYLRIGSYSIEAIFAGDEFCTESNAAFNFNVLEKRVNATMEVSVEDGKVIVELKDLDGNPIENAVVAVSMNGVNQSITTDSEGKASVTPTENGTVAISYTDSNGLSVSEKLAVFFTEVETNQTVERSATQIIYEDMATTAVDTASDGRVGEYFVITLKDSNGNPLANKSVQIGFNGKVYPRTTDANGQAKLQINLEREGIYTFAIAFLGDDEYNGTFAVAKITVSKQKGSLTVPNKSYAASAKTKTLTATFKSAAGNVVAGKKVTFTVNGKTYSATTNAKGVATVNVSLNKKGTYSFTAKFAGDGAYKAITKSAKLTIK